MGLLIGFVAGTLIDDRFVRFENTRSVPRSILRVLGGIAGYFVLNVLLKLPFNEAFLASGSLAALLVRCGRYALISTVLFGVYPLLFRVTAKIGAPKAAQEEEADHA